MTTDPGDLVFDPTCGSGTTAYVAEQLGAALDHLPTLVASPSRLARTRLMAAKISVLPTGRLPQRHQEGGRPHRQSPARIQDRHDDIRKGFVYKRVPHITLKSIANDPDIKEGMTREEIDAVIARHADTEILYDQPYEDNKCVRVCGPLSVESLSPHRVLSTADENQDGTVSEHEGRKQQDFSTMILENLKKGGPAEHPQERTAQNSTVSIRTPERGCTRRVNTSTLKVNHAVWPSASAPSTAPSVLTK